MRDAGHRTPDAGHRTAKKAKIIYPPPRGGGHNDSEKMGTTINLKTK